MDDFSRGEPVLGQPIVPVLGYANIARANQRAQLFHKLTHAIPPFGYMDIPRGDSVRLRLRRNASTDLLLVSAIASGAMTQVSRSAISTLRRATRG